MGFINLYLEGTFYKAYEQSAFAFFTRIKAYNVLRKESETLGRDILYVALFLLEDTSENVRRGNKPDPSRN